MKLSIITINFNNVEGIEKTFQSVFSQTYKDFEYIVIDGGSTDGSKELIEKYNDQISFWTSEPDNGIYHAMNKGIFEAKGVYCLFLNSGDFLIDENVIFSVINIIEKHGYDIDLIFGKIAINEKENIEDYPKKINLNLLLNSYLPHPATFFRRESIKNGYDLNFKICADYAMILHLLIRNARYLCVDLPVTVFFTDGISSNPMFIEIIKQERRNIQRSYIGDIILEELNIINNRPNKSLIKKFLLKLFKCDFIKKLA